MFTTYDPPRVPTVGKLLAAAEDIDDWWETATPRARALTGTSIGVAGIAVVLVIAGLLRLVVATGKLLVEGATTVVDAVSLPQLANVVTDPVTGYLRNGATELDLPTNALTVAWAIVAGVLFLGSLLQSWGARIGWIAFGAATVAMTYAGTEASARGSAAAVAIGAWALLSVLAFVGTGHSTPIYIFPPTRRSNPPTEADTSPLGRHANERYLRNVQQILNTWKREIANDGDLAGSVLHVTAHRHGWIGTVQLVPGKQHTGTVRDAADRIRAAYNLTPDQLQIEDSLSADLATIRVFAAHKE